MWLSVGTVFCSYPQSIYRRCAIDVWEYIKDGLATGNIGGHRNTHDDSWVGDMICSTSGWTSFYRKKRSYENPGVCLNLEIYDIHIANRRLKMKEHLVRCDRTKLNPRTSPWVNMFKIKIG